MAKYINGDGNIIHHPDLPASIATHPFACIGAGVESGESFFYLLLSTVPICWAGPSFSGGMKVSADGSVIKYKQNEATSQWDEYDNKTLSYGENVGLDCLDPDWANYDVYWFESNNIFLSACPDPIPVGSAPEVEPKAFILGYLAGQKARQLRYKLADTEDITDAELIDGVLYIRNANAKQLNDILEVT